MTSHELWRALRSGWWLILGVPLLAAATLSGVHAIAAVALKRSARPPAAEVVEQVWAFVSGAVGLAVEGKS